MERRAAVRLQPNNAFYHYQLGVTLHEMQKYAEAEVAKREARLVADGPNAEVSQEELTRAVKHLQAHWNRRYGLVEVG